MPAIKPENRQTIMNVFLLFGCEYKRKKGSHHILTYPNMRTFGMSREKYLELLRKV